MDSSSSLETKKHLLRKELRQKLEQMKPEERARRSEGILQQVFGHPRFAEAEKVLSYIAVAPEVETWPFVEEGLRRGKRVYVPRVDQEKKKIWVIEITGKEKLSPSSYGILEPPFDEKRLGEAATLDLVVVPGLGFDRRGGRLGRGGGYFDRFLGEAKKAYKIGLAFECQIVDLVPREPHDVALDEILIG